MPVVKPVRSAQVLSHQQMTDFVEHQKDWVCSDANEYLDIFEAFVETKFRGILHSAGIHATVKRDKFSLPHMDEIIVDIPFQSYTNAVFDYRRLARKVLPELLGMDLHKLRFYIWTDIVVMNRDEWFAFPEHHPFHYGLRYHFRYCI